MVMPTIQDFRGLPDPLLQYRWTLIIPNVPGGGDARRIQYQCQTSSIPGLSNEEVLVTAHGIDLRFAGREQYGGTLNCQFYETRDGVIIRTFRNWLKFQRDAETGTGNYKEDYAVSGQLLLLDDKVKEAFRIEFLGLHMGDLQEASVDGSSSAPVQFSVTFRYDYSKLV